MTPYEIDVLLWYYARVEDHPDMMRDPPVWRPTIDQFQASAVLVLRTGASAAETCYVLTDRGRAYVDALQRVPLPTMTWTVEWPSRIGETQVVRDDSRCVLRGDPVVPRTVDGGTRV